MICSLLVIRALLLLTIPQTLMDIASDERIRCLTEFGSMWARQRKMVANAWARQSLVCCQWFLTRLHWGPIQFPGRVSGVASRFSPSRTRPSLWRYRLPATTVSSLLRSCAPLLLVSLRCCFLVSFAWAQVRSSTIEFFLLVPFFTSSPPPHSFVL